MSKKLFKALLGNRVFLVMPKQDEKKVIVDENTREALQREFNKKMQRAVVYAKGDTVNNIEVGDVVLVDDKALAQAAVIPLDDETMVILVSPFDIIMVW
jgi:hypothetical protein